MLDRQQPWCDALGCWPAEKRCSVLARRLIALLQTTLQRIRGKYYIALRISSLALRDAEMICDLRQRAHHVMQAETTRGLIARNPSNTGSIRPRVVIDRNGVRHQCWT